MYCRPLVEAGRVYAGLSPLYHLNKGTKNWKFFIDKDDVNKYVRKEFCNNFTVSNIRTKKPLTSQQLTNLIDTNYEYPITLDHIANNYAIHPILLEDILIARDFKFKDFKKAIESKYKYINVYQKGKSTIVEGLVDDGKAGEQTIILDQRTWNAFLPLINYIDRSDKRYLMNGKKVGLYEIISTFHNTQPKNMERAKGLGSLKDYEIGISTLSPDNRKLLRYTSKDIMNEIEQMRKMHDDRNGLIQGIDISKYEF